MRFCVTFGSGMVAGSLIVGHAGNSYRTVQLFLMFFGVVLALAMARRDRVKLLKAHKQITRLRRRFYEVTHRERGALCPVASRSYGAPECSPSCRNAQRVCAVSQESLNSQGCWEPPPF